MLTLETRQSHDVAVAPVARPPRPSALRLVERATPPRRSRRARRAPIRLPDHWEDAARAQLAGVGMTYRL